MWLSVDAESAFLLDGAGDQQVGPLGQQVHIAPLQGEDLTDSRTRGNKQEDDIAKIAIGPRPGAIGLLAAFDESTDVGNLGRGLE